MEREQIIKALGCCVIGDCYPCQYRETVNCRDIMFGDALSLIKELIEENEWQEDTIVKLSAENVMFLSEKKKLTAENEAISERYVIQVVTAIELDKQVQRLTEENERLRAEVSVKKKLLDEAERRYDETAKRFYKEGVKDIQSEIKKTLSALCKGDVTDICRMIDQIAKEMVEEKT